MASNNVKQSHGHVYCTPLMQLQCHVLDSAEEKGCQIVVKCKTIFHNNMGVLHDCMSNNEQAKLAVACWVCSAVA